MPITVQCDECGFRYAAPEALLGKRVRCKRCSAVFTVAEASAVAGAVNVPDHTDADSGALSEMDDIDAILRGGSGAAGGEPTASPDEIARAVQPFDFPYSQQVDRFLPLGLLVISLLLIISQTLAQDDLGRPWLATVRVLLLLGLYAVIVFPITYVGVKHGVRKHGGHMPWSPGWKTFAIFTIAYALSYMLWLAGTNIASLLLGCLAGLGVSLTALWLVFRPRLDRGFDPLVWSGVAFVLAILVAGGFVAGLNLTTFAITSGSQTAHTFAASPILPGLPWNPPPPPEDPYAPLPTPAIPGATDQLATPDPTLPPDGTGLQPDAPVVSTEDPTVDAPADPLAGDPPSVDPTSPDTTAPVVVDPTSPADPQPPVPPVSDPQDAPVAVDPPEPPADTPDRPTLPPGQATTAIQPSELVAVNHPPVEGGFERVIHPLAAGEFVAVIRSVGEDDIIECWRLADWARIGQARFRPDPNAGEQYAISPDGARLARIVSWPSLSIQTWSFKDQRVTEMLELNTENGQPTLLGFVSPTQLLLGWQKGGAHGVELLDLQTRRRVVAVLEGVETLERNVALSPDGRFFAVAAVTRDGPAIVVYNMAALAGGRPMRMLPIRMLDPRWGVRPAGLAFSEDGSALAAYFEQDGNGLLLNWTLSTGRENQPYIFPAGSIPQREDLGGDRVFSYLNRDQWLLYGRDVIDIRTGRLLGSTGIESVLTQRRIAAGMLVVYIDEKNQSRLAILTRKPAGDE